MPGIKPGYTAVLLTLTLLAGCGCDQVFSATAQAWLDENHNGMWEAGEPPLQGVTFMAIDQRGVVSWKPSGVSDTSGTARLYTMYGCTGNAEWIIEAQIPAGYEATTSLRIPEGSQLRFGFAPAHTR
jgi:hypothetical protein